MSKNKVKFGMIGCGNMGTAILQSVIAKKIFKASEIAISEPDIKRKNLLKKKFKVQTLDNTAIASSADVILLAVKPQQMTEVLNEMSPHISSRTLIISIAAGLDTAFFSKHLPKTRLIRVMPNMGIMLGLGATGLFAASTAKPQDKKLAQKIFAAGGVALFVPQEELLDSVTAVSGSGPAFVFLFIQSLIEAGIGVGLSPKVCRELVLQTVRGSLEIVSQSQETITDLIQKIASKGGTTEAGLQSLEKDGFTSLIQKTITAASLRAKELRCIS